MRNDIYTRAIVNRWKQQKIARRGATHDALVRLEGVAGGALPQHLVSLLSFADGMEPGVVDQHMVRFWPSHEIALATDAFPGCDAALYGSVLVFADFCIWAHAYGVEITQSVDGGRVCIVGGAAPTWCFSSFAHFLERYVDAPHELFGPAS